MSDVAKLEKTLARLTQDGTEAGKILNAAERLLALKPQHAMALQCKAVCCMYADKFGAALSALDTLDASGARNTLSSEAAANTRFQRAYCLYRMRRYTEAKAVLTSTAHGSLKAHVPSRHLLAQVYYNLEAFTEAAAIYRALLDEDTARDEEERAELETNYAAVLASGTNPTQAVTVAQSATEKTGDLAYNAATALVEAQDYTGAMKALRQAEALYARAHAQSSVRSLKDALALDEAGRAATLGADGSPERRLFNDVANTWVQMAFVHHAMREEAEAAEVLSLVLAARPSSAVTAAVAAVNWTAIRRGADFVEASKKLRAAQHAKVASRLTTKQNLMVRYNTALLHLNAGNLRSCRRLVDAMAKDHPESELAQSLRLVIAARESKGKRHQAASAVEGLVKEFVDQRGRTATPASAASVPLIAVQVYVENGDLARALEAFESPALAEMATRPAALATRAAWMAQLGRVADALSLLERSLPTLPSTTAQKSLLLWAVHFFLTVGEGAGASPGPTAAGSAQAQVAGLLQRARASVPALAADRELAAMLGLALARAGDTAGARQCLSTFVPATAPAPSRSEIAALEKSAPSRAAVEELGYHRRTTAEAVGGVTGGSTAAAAAAAGLSGEEKPRLRKRRARPMRRPPRVMPEKGGKAPDPERWVPMPLRSYIKDLPPRKKKELKRLRALEQDQKRRAAERRKAEAAGTAPAPQ